MSQFINPEDAESSNVFQIKVITWSEYEHRTPILLQDLNGPCPLIALVNTLLLKNEIDIRNETFNPIQDEFQVNRQRKSDGINNLKLLLLKDHLNAGSITLTKLLAQLGDILLVMLEVYQNKVSNYNLDNLLKSLPLLHTGLSVNPNLVDGEFPPEDLSTTLFDVFDLKLRHGWYYSPSSSSILPGVDNDVSLQGAFRDLQTFDKIQDFLLYEPRNDIQEDLRIEIEEKQRMIKAWLDNNPTQLTDAGMKHLNRTLEAEEFIVFFRNNHFSTLYKKDENDFYTLLTDASFHRTDKSYKDIVWQSFISVSGKDDLFFAGDFVPVLEDIEYSSPDDDYMLIKQLQEEEDEAIAKQMQQRYNKNGDKMKDKLTKKDGKQSPPLNKSSNSLKTKLKKKSTCIIV
ncbi:uncharacterized protein AC631_04404 [Debaryomyces fabryi]|uniref:MINDY deubiquitinase domain-containing protein n=1 Tax=Debaryomyces fabryi TaxID=58627 RepID=A0A0V1PUC8_9ASCO|nr:uncharacterized protein AC631_04404 [Debaryomyces fabryi]KRZ99847.1 hypothetical protein AC631_04404 [Debaryomyces fabryi]CUM56627.1 unnamed protein product [Debaryomyces fabryi]